MKMPFHAGGRNAFSLLELLVAIGLLAVLYAVASGTWQRVAENSHAAKCQSNLRNLSMAGLLYAADNNGLLPDRARWSATTATTTKQSILPYMGVAADSGENHANMLVCPSAMHGEYKPADTSRSYSINQYATGSDVASDMTWQSQVKNREAPIHLINVKSPSTQAFFMDGTFISDEYGARYSAFQDSARLGARNDAATAGWKTPFLHNEAIYVAFMDGHVERITREYAEKELIGPANPSESQAHTSPRTRPFWGAGK